MKKKVPLLVIMFSICWLSFVHSEDKSAAATVKTSAGKANTESSQAAIPKQTTFEKKLEALVNQQDQQQKSIQALAVKIDKQTEYQSAFQSTMKKNLESMQNHLDTKLTALADTQKNQDKIQSEFSKINESMETLRANIFQAISDVEQRNLDVLKNDHIEKEKQASAILDVLQEIKETITVGQSKHYSAINASMNSLDLRIVTLNDQISENISAKKDDTIQQVLNDQLSSHQEVLKTMESHIQNLVNTMASQLNSDINTHIQGVKTDFSRLKQAISDDMANINTQVLEIKHEQQLELQSLVKQFSQDMTRHDQNISEAISKAEGSLNHSHLTWIIYGLVVVIVGLFIFIIWDRNTSVAPLLARIRRLEDNLVIEY
ncbi:MAG: hypothetical protein HQK75_17600 [Candidatus Magnetomorum sp.]|nr:hypothetical protein [Candidatus Magnetomorum sp.]